MNRMVSTRGTGRLYTRDAVTDRDAAPDLGTLATGTGGLSAQSDQATMRAAARLARDNGSTELADELDSIISRFAAGPTSTRTSPIGITSTDAIARGRAERASNAKVIRQIRDFGDRQLADFLSSIPETRR